MTKIYKGGAQSILGLFILTLILTSCVKDENFTTEGTQHPGSLSSIVIDTLNVTTYTTTEENILGKTYGTLWPDHSKENNFIVGELNDPIFGYTESTVFSNVRLSEDSTYLGNGFDIDSVTVYLVVRGDYGDEDFTNQITLYETEETLTDSSYTTQSSINEGDLIGSKDVKVSLVDTLHDAYGNALRMITVNAESSFLSLLQDRVNNAGFDYINEDNLNQIFNGIKIGVTTSNPSVGEGDLVYLEMENQASRVKVYHHNNLNSKSSLTFEFKNENKFNSVVHDFSSAADLSNQLSDSTLGQQQVYLQGLAGAIVNLELSDFQEVINQYPNAIISELTVKTYVINNDTADFDLPTKAYVYAVEENGDRFIHDNDYFSSANIGELGQDEFGYYYEFSLAAYMEANKNNGISLFKIKLGGETTVNDKSYYTGKVFVGNRAVLSGINHADENLRLKIKMILTDI